MSKGMHSPSVFCQELNDTSPLAIREILVMDALLRGQMMVVLRRSPCMFLEESTECRGVREVQGISNFLYRHTGGGKQEDATADDGAEDELMEGISADVPCDGGEVFRREAKLVSIEVHIAVLHEILAYKVQQAFEDFHPSSLPVRSLVDVAAEDVAHTVGEGHEQEFSLFVGEVGIFIVEGVQQAYEVL